MPKCRPRHGLVAAMLLAVLACSEPLLAQTATECRAFVDNTVRIVARSAAGAQLSVGAGVVISLTKNEAVVLTAYHVIKEGALHVVFPQKRWTEFPAVRFRNHVDDIDLGVVIVRPLPGEPLPTELPPVIYDSRLTLQTGPAVTIVGHPGDEEWKCVPAANRITAPSSRFDIRLFQISRAGVSNGHSGGPVFSQSGDLLGIVTETKPDEGDNVAIRFLAALETIRGWGLPVGHLADRAAVIPPAAHATSPSPVVPPRTVDPPRTVETGVRSTFDRFTNTTTVRLTLGLRGANSSVTLSSTHDYTGQAPGGLPEYVLVFFDGLSCSGDSLTMLVDGARLQYPVNRSVVRFAPADIARLSQAGSVEGRYCSSEFVLGSADKTALVDYLQKIGPSPYNRSVLDAPRVNGWSVSQTLTYLNGLLARMPVDAGGNVPKYFRIEYDSRTDVLSVLARFGTDSYYDKEEARVADLSWNVDFLSDATVLIRCLRKRTCTSSSLRTPVQPEWTRSNSMEFLTLYVGEDRRNLEIFRNGLSYVIERINAARETPQ